MLDIFAKFDKLRQVFKDTRDQKMIGHWQEQWKKSYDRSELANHPEMKIFILELKNEILSIDKELCTNRDLTELQRCVLFSKKDIYQQIINKLSSAEITKNRIENEVEDNISQYI